MKDVLIIGGGIIGLTTALELQQRGLAVTLLEKGRAGDGATGAAGGILSPLCPWRCDPTMMAMFTLSLSRYRQLLDGLETQSEPVCLIASGLLYLPRDRNSAEVMCLTVWAEAQGWRFSALDAGALMREEPTLDGNTGFLFPDVCQVETRVLLGALAHTARRRGISIHENCTVYSIAAEKKHATGAHTDTGFIAADIVVACAGAWTASLLPAPFWRPEIRPVRGQIIEYAAPAGLLRHIVSYGTQEETAMYLIPRPDGRILVGSTLEDCGFDDSITETARTRLTEFAARVLPTLPQYPISSQWAGLRPAASRTMPFIGAHPEIDRLFINSGHHRNGIALAPASALLTAQLICEETTAMDMKAFELTPGKP